MLQENAGIKPDLTTKGERRLLAEPSYGFVADNFFLQTTGRDADANGFEPFRVRSDADGS